MCPRHTVDVQRKIDSTMAEIRKYFSVEKVHSIVFTPEGEFIQCEIADTLSEEEKTLLVSIIRRINDIDIFDTLKLRDLTAAEIETWVDNNVTDLTSAKRALKILAKMILFLYKRMEKE